MHLGAFLLLRVSPILDRSPLLCAAVVAVGLLTAIFAASATRVQSDIKCALCFASLTQIGIIVAEIGLGLRYIALIHILSHGCLRTLQFVRAPSLLYDYRSMENAIGDRLPKSAANWDRWIPAKFQVWFYRMALERGYLDASLSNYIVVPFMRVFGWFDAVEHRWTRFLAGSSANPPEENSPSMASLDELL